MWFVRVSLAAVLLSGCAVQTGSPSSLQPCGRTPDVQEADGRDCTVACPSGEACNSGVSCGPPAEGHWSCFDQAGRDERCHRTCDSDEDCASGESCVEGGNYGCSDVAQTFKICCVDGDCSKG